MNEDQIFDLANRMGLRPCRDRSDGSVTIQPLQPDSGYYNRRFCPNDNLDDACGAIEFMQAELVRLTAKIAELKAADELYEAAETGPEYSFAHQRYVEAVKALLEEMGDK